MKPRVKINGRSPYGDWEPGDTGVVDGYCRGGNDVPYAIVILDKNHRFVMVNIEQLEQDGDFISEEDYRDVIQQTARHFYELGLKAKEE